MVSNVFEYFWMILKTLFTSTDNIQIKCALWVLFSVGVLCGILFMSIVLLITKKLRK